MNIPSLLISLSLPTLLWGHNNGRSCMKSLQCDQGFWKRTNNDIEHSCYEQSQKYRYEREDRMKRFKGRHLTSFSINNEEYQLFTGNETVIMTKWSEDDKLLHKEQRLNIASAYSAEVIFHNGDAILLVAVYNNSRGCESCDRHDNQNPSVAFLWNHKHKKFNKNHFQNLPAARIIESYSERYRYRSTVISVFTKCGCNTSVYYFDESDKVFKEIDQNNSLPFKNVMVVQSVRYSQSQYILFAPLNRHNEREPISIFKWTQTTGSLTFHKNLSTYINEDTGLSTTVFKNDVFLCSVSDASQNVTIYWLKPDQGHLEEIRHIQGKEVFSMCKFLTQDQEQYAAVGYKSKVELLQYNPVARNFTHAVNLRRAINTIDLINFQGRDDAYIVTTEYHTTYCKSKVYRKIHSPPSEPHH